MYRYTLIVDTARSLRSPIWIVSSLTVCTTTTTYLTFTFAGLESILAPELATSLVLRPATRDDCSTIHKYLRAHARWDGCPDEFEITEEGIELLIINGYNNYYA